MAKHNWPELRRRYVSGEWLTLEEMAEKTQISISGIKKRSMSEKWNDKRTAFERETETKAMERLTTRLAREAEKRLPGWLDLADALKKKALEAMTAPDFAFTGTEAIRAASESVAIESKLFMPKASENGTDEHSGLRIGLTQININVAPGESAKLKQPTPMTDFTNEQLIAFLGRKGLESPRVMDSEDGADGRGLRSRAVKKAKRIK